MAVAAIAAVGCAKDDAAPVDDRRTTTSVTAQEWADRLDSGCKALSERYSDLLSARPSDRASALAHIERIGEFSERLRTTVDELDPPGDEASALQAQVAELAEVSSALSQAAEAGDEAATSAAIAQLNDIGEKINSQATALGVESCGGF